MRIYVGNVDSTHICAYLRKSGYVCYLPYLPSPIPTPPNPSAGGGESGVGGGSSTQLERNSEPSLFPPALPPDRKHSRRVHRETCAWVRDVFVLGSSVSLLSHPIVSDVALSALVSQWPPAHNKKIYGQG